MLGAAIAALYLFVPALLEGIVARELRDRLGLEAVPEVDLRGSPVGMLAGEFGGGEVRISGYDLGDARAEEVVVELAPFGVDVLGSVAGGGVSFQRPPPSGILRVQISEEEVGRVAAAEVTGFRIPGVDLEEGRAVARIETNGLGQSLPVSVEGGVSAQENVLVFEPTDIEASGVEIPRGTARYLLRGTSFVYPINGLPSGAKINGARAEDDRLVLTGRMDLGRRP